MWLALAVLGFVLMYAKGFMHASIKLKRDKWSKRMIVMVVVLVAQSAVAALGMRCQGERGDEACKREVTWLMLINLALFLVIICMCLMVSEEASDEWHRAFTNGEITEIYDDDDDDDEREGKVGGGGKLEGMEEGRGGAVVQDEDNDDAEKNDKKDDKKEDKDSDKESEQRKPAGGGGIMGIFGPGPEELKRREEKKKEEEEEEAAKAEKKRLKEEKAKQSHLVDSLYDVDDDEDEDI